MLFALWLACAGPESAEDLDELLDRTEALEREVATLRAARETPVVLLDVRCERAGDVVAFPAWLAPTPPLTPSVGLWTSTTIRDGDPAWRWEGAEGAMDVAGSTVECGEDERSLYGQQTRWVVVPL